MEVPSPFGISMDSGNRAGSRDPSEAKPAPGYAPLPLSVGVKLDTAKI